MADDRDSLLREVEEELRREQMQKIWKQYSGLIIAGAVMIPVSVLGFQWYRISSQEAAETSGANFEQALRLADEKKAEDAAKAFEAIAAGGGAGYAQLARLHLAGALAKSGKTDRAVEAYELLAKSSSGDPLLKDFAGLQAASLRLGAADFTEMQNRLKPLSADGQPFKISASELLGVAAFKAGKFAEARELLEPLLIDPEATPSIQERIKIVLAEIASKEVAGAADAAAKPAEAPPAAAPDKK